MVQAPDLGNRYNRPRPGRLNSPLKRRIFAQREVRAGTLVVVKVRFQDTPQTGLIQDDHVIQAFPTNRADQSLNVTNAQPACCLVKFLSVTPIPIAQTGRLRCRENLTSNAGRCPTEKLPTVGEPPIQLWDIPSPPRGRTDGGRATESRRQIRHERTRSEPRRSRRRPYPSYGLSGTCARFARVVSDDASCTWRP